MSYLRSANTVRSTRVSLFVEPKAGIEPATYSLRVNCSTPEPLWRAIRIYLFGKSVSSEKDGDIGNGRMPFCAEEPRRVCFADIIQGFSLTMI